MKTLIISLILIFNLLSFEKVNAENNFSYLDLDLILSASLAGKSISNQILIIQENNNKKFTKQQKKLLEQEKSIIGKKNILSKEEFDKSVLAFKKDVNNFKKKRAELIKKTNNQRLKAMKLLLDKLNPILAKYSDDNSISLIVQKKNIIIGKSELDITSDIMKLLNKEIKKININ